MIAVSMKGVEGRGGEGVPLEPREKRCILTRNHPRVTALMPDRDTLFLHSILQYDLPLPPGPE